VTQIYLSGQATTVPGASREASAARAASFKRPCVYRFTFTCREKCTSLTGSGDMAADGRELWAGFHALKAVGGLDLPPQSAGVQSAAVLKMLGGPIRASRKASGTAFATLNIAVLTQMQRARVRIRVATAMKPWFLRDS
jgi:hypothetical protein